jgi:hypothetical protein
MPAGGAARPKRACSVVTDAKWWREQADADNLAAFADA